MVTRLHRDALRSDIETIKSLLAKSAGRDPLGEKTLSKRLQSLEEQLNAVDSTVRSAASVALIFEGSPVKGSSAIDADFAGQALQDYQELLTKQLAAADGNELPQRGPLPREIRRQARMNVTGIVHGSFGFLLEEDNAEQVEMFESPALRAVEAVTDLLKGVASGDERWFDEKLPELDIRIFQSLRRFVNTLYNADATLKLSEDRRELQLNSQDVLRAHERVTQVDVDEVDESFDGELLGIVPIARRFEFRRADGGEVISGRVSQNLSADYLERIEREEAFTGRSWHAVVRTKTITKPTARHTSVIRLLIDLLELDRKPETKDL